nr:reverse transcriptase domain-containing protein [Tanacetum cinerariifolium]
MADNPTMEEMLQAPREGYGDAIVVPDIVAENFEIRTGLLSLIQENQFHGFESNNPHDHIKSFNRITSTLKFRDEPNDAIKLTLFPYSLDGGIFSSSTDARIDKFMDIISNLVETFNKKMTTPTTVKAVKETCVICGGAHPYYDCIATDSNISSACVATEAWKRFKEMLRQCPHHGFSELHQINTFYNGLNKHEQDSLNAAAGGNLLRKTALDALTIIENKSKVRYLRNKLVDFKVSITSSGSSSSTDARIDKLTDTISNLVETFNKKITTPATVIVVKETCVICGGAQPYYDCIATDSNISSACAATDNFKAGLKNEIHSSMQNQINNVKNELKSNINEIRNMMASYFQKDTASTSGSGLLPSNTIANPMGDLKAITTRSGVSYDGPPIPSPISSLRKVVELVPEVTKDTVQPSTVNIQPPVAQTQVLIDEPVVSPKPKLTIPYPSRATQQKLSITFKVGQTLKYSYNDAKSINQIDVIDVACEEYVQEVLGFSDNSKSGNPTLISDPIIALSSHSLTQFEGGDFIFKEMEACLTSKSIPPGIDDIDFDLEGDTHLLEELLNNDPSSSSLLPKELNVEEIKTVKSSIDEPPELELKELPSHLEYAFLEGTDKLPVIISKQLKDEEKSALLKVLKSHKRAIAPVHCVPKKGGMTVVKNEDNELIPTRLVTGWRVCIDYQKLNDATQKDHFSLPFMDQMLERLIEKDFYCFFDGFFGYFQIPIDPQDQENTAFTCPYGTFAYRRMPFGLCNAPGTFQRCMMAIFDDMIEETMEVVMNNFSVLSDSFSLCLSYLDQMLKRCKDTNLVLNWEKCHFMVMEGIVLDYKISKFRIEVDRAKVDVIAKLPHPTSVKGVRSFLGHAGLYR